MGTAIHRSPQAERGEFVSSPPNPEAGGEIALVASPSLLGVEEGYERWAPSYDHAPNPVIAREERYVRPLLPNLEGKNVLDLACGTGRWLERLLARGASAGAGVDVSRAMLQVAGGKSSIHGKLANADCLELPFAPFVFDFAICSFALGHIRDVRRMVGELARVTKPGGEVLVSDLHPEAYARGWRTGFRDARSAVQIETHARNPEEIVRAFHASGMECLSYVSLCLGEAERPIFVAANKEHEFEASCRVPAVLVYRFKRCRIANRELS
jgi:malonyl-CoA O-methyltransferase